MGEVRDRKTTAHHEAGHTVVAWRLGLGVKMVSIDTEDCEGRNGCTDYQTAAQMRVPDDHAGYNWDSAVRSLAACPAEKRFTGKGECGGNDDPDKPGSDACWATHYLEAGDYPTADYAKVEGEAAQLVREHWTDIGKIAALLLDKETLKTCDIADEIGPLPEWKRRGVLDPETVPQLSRNRSHSGVLSGNRKIRNPHKR